MIYYFPSYYMALFIFLTQKQKLYQHLNELEKSIIILLLLSGQY